MHVLFVEDDAMNRRVVHDMLSVGGIQMTEAPDGPAGLAMIDHDEFDVVLMDLRMPGMDGLTAIGHLRARPDDKARLPVIVVTADTTPNLRDECITAGADEMLLKPVSMQDLFDTIGRLVAERGGKTLIF